MKKDHRWSIFPNGDAFETWDDRNCSKCKKQYVDGATVQDCHWLCEIQKQIDIASCGDGRLAEEARELIGKRLKWDGEGYLDHDCPEFERL